MKNRISRIFFLFSFLLFPLSINAASGLGVRTLYSSTNVGTTNWKVIVASTPNTVSYVSIFDSSGQTLEVGICSSTAATNSEVRQILIPPGGTASKIQIPVGQRISIRAVSGTATNGENDFNVLF